MRNRFFKLSLLTCALILSIATFSVAQDLDDVTISGKVTDSNNQPITGASVNAKLVTTGAERTVQSDDEGRYRLIDLPSGVYVVKITATGFGVKERKDLTTVSGQNVQLNFQLAPGDVAGVVEVTSQDDATETVDTTRTVVGGTITERDIEEIPNNTRNALDLVLTLGGTGEEQLSTGGLSEDRNTNLRSTPLEQGNFSLSGGTAYSNNITIDSFDNNDDRSSRDRFQPSLEAIGEVQVITNQFSAEYGRASGGRVNITTRSGTNRYRGRAFMFFRDARLNANTWNNNSRGIARLPLTEYNPGFTIGGPLSIPFGEGRRIYDGRNKTFFFFAYEYNKLLDTTLIDTYVPVGSNPNFILPSSTGGTSACDNASAAACASVPPTAGLVAPYIRNFDTPNVNHIITAKIDHKLTNSNTMTFGWQFGRRNNRRTSGASTTRVEDALQAQNSNSDAFNFTDTQYGAKYSNQFKMQWSQFLPSFQTDDPLAPVVLIGYRNPLLASTQTLIAGNSTTSTLQNFADTRKETRWQFQDSVTYIAGSHSLKFGVDMQNVNSKTTGLGDSTGTFNFNSVLNYQNNSISRYRQNFGTASDVKNRYYGAYFNDQFRPFSTVTLSYGVRYEKETAVSDDNNWGPRLGIAWDPFKSGKGVIRFGGGIFYNRVLLRTVGDSIQNANLSQVSFDSNRIGTAATDPRRVAVLARIAQQFPNRYLSLADFRSTVAAVCASIVTTSSCNSSTGFGGSVSDGGSALRSVDENLKIPESYQFNIGFEREIAKGLIFEANYTWNKTANLWRDTNPNAPRLPAGFSDWTSYLIENPFVFSDPATPGTVRTYRFYLGSTTDGSGTATTQGGIIPCVTTGITTCWVNLNTVNIGTTTPSIAVAGSTTNSIGSPVPIAIAAISRFRPDQTVEETSKIRSIGNTKYQGLILELRSRFRKIGAGFGATVRAAYTLSSTRDDGLNNTANAEVNGDFSREFARNLSDRRHRFALSGTFDTPKWMGRVKFSPLFRYGSSAPFNLGAGGTDRNLDDLGTDRLNFSGSVKDIVTRNPGSAFPTALAAQFSLQPIGSKSGNLPRNSGTGPSFYTFDLSVTKEFKISERVKFRPTAQFDNILNAAVFSYGSEFIDFTALRNDGTPPSATQITNFNNFLVPQRTFRQRQIRLGFRLDF
jgi:predicted small secreted protein